MRNTEDHQEPETESAVRTISASEFKAKCLKIMDEVAETGGRVVITKRGKPVVELWQARELRKPIFGSMRGSVEILGDIESPIDVEWGAMK